MAHLTIYSHNFSFTSSTRLNFLSGCGHLSQFEYADHGMGIHFPRLSCVLNTSALKFEISIDAYDLMKSSGLFRPRPLLCLSINMKLKRSMLFTRDYLYDAEEIISRLDEKL